MITKDPGSIWNAVPVAYKCASLANSEFQMPLDLKTQAREVLILTWQLAPQRGHTKHGWGHHMGNEFAIPTGWFVRSVERISQQSGVHQSASGKYSSASGEHSSAKWSWSVSIWMGLVSLWCWIDKQGQMIAGRSGLFLALSKSIDIDL